jgi:hypothetical protein
MGSGAEARNISAATGAGAVSASLGKVTGAVTPVGFVSAGLD